jgi:hypothetical protein
VWQSSFVKFLESGRAMELCCDVLVLLVKGVLSSEVGCDVAEWKIWDDGCRSASFLRVAFALR